MSSKRAIRRRACEGKLRYASAAEAEAARKRARRRRALVEGYRCPFCSGYHVGHRGRAATRPDSKWVRPRRKNK